MQQVDVLIVGAGPTGGMLALELAMQNISFRIIDKDPVRSERSRALVVQPRTLELLDRHGITKDLIAMGEIGNGMCVFINKKMSINLGADAFDHSHSTHPEPLYVSQADTERFIDATLRNKGYEVERPFTVEKFVEDHTGVTASLRRVGVDGEDTEDVRCKYIIGCDGAHSFVRKSAGISFEGGAYEQEFMLVDVRVKWDHPTDRLTMFMGKDGVLMAFPLRDGRSRLVSRRPPEAVKNSEPTLSEFEGVFAKMAPGHMEMSDPIGMCRYNLHHRSAGRYRVGRVLLAGDAAHIHSPAGGQGMNTGMQDAVNMAWKLASVVRGERDDSLLDSYDTERRKVGEHLLKTTDSAFQRVVDTNKIRALVFSWLASILLPLLMKSRIARVKYLAFTTQLRIRYRTSPIVGTASKYKGKLLGGDRAIDGPLQDDGNIISLLEVCRAPTHHLVLFSGTGSTAADEDTLQDAGASFLKTNVDWITLHKFVTTKSSPSGLSYLDKEGKLHDIYGFAKPSYVLVRPDGHIAHIGHLKAIEEMNEWLSKQKAKV